MRKKSGILKVAVSGISLSRIYAKNIKMKYNLFIYSAILLTIFIGGGCGSNSEKAIAMLNIIKVAEEAEINQQYHFAEENYMQALNEWHKTGIIKGSLFNYEESINQNLCKIYLN